MSKMQVEQLNPYSCLTYLITNNGDEAVLVDPVIEHIGDYLSLLEERNLHLRYVIDTHTHADHISGASALKDRAGCEYIMHEMAPARCPGIRVRSGDVLEILPGLMASIHYTPGHTEDSISIDVGGILFTGDALFLDDGGAGRDDLPGGDSRTHFNTLELFRSLPDYLLVHPAHDYRGRHPSTLADQKINNPHLRVKDQKEYVEYIHDLRLGPADWMTDVLKANYSCAMSPGAAWIPVDVPACEVKGTMDSNVNEVVVNSISASLAKRKYDSCSSPLMVDVREPEELEEELGHIPGALNFPIGDLINGIPEELDFYKRDEIIVVCRSGGRAHTAAQILTHFGFPNVFVLEGGMLAWKGL